MSETSFIGKILCAAAVAAVMGTAIPSSIGGLLEGSAATENQILAVKLISGCLSAIIGACLGWVHSQLLITGAIFAAIANGIMGIFSP